MSNPGYLFASPPPPLFQPDQSQVIICGRREEQIKAAAEEMNAAAKEGGLGGEAIAIQADVGNKAGCIEFFEKASKVFDKVNPLPRGVPRTR